MKHRIYYTFIFILFFSITQLLLSQNQPMAKIHVDEDGHVEILEVFDRNVPSLTSRTESQNEKKNENNHNQESNLIISTQAISPAGRNHPSNTMNPGPNLDAVSAACNLNYNSTTISITIDVRVENNGTTAADMSYLGIYLSSDYDIYTDDILIGNIPVPSLSPGTYSDETATINISSSPGTWWVGFIIDYTDLVDEENESDNYWYFAGTIAVQVSNLYAVDYELETIERWAYLDTMYVALHMDITLINGGSIATGAFHIGYYLSKDEVITKSDVLIEDMSMGSMFIDWPIPFTHTICFAEYKYTGIWIFGFIIDYLDEVIESDETDNTGYITPALEINLPLKQPDLIVTDILITDCIAPQIEYHYTVRNQGDANTGQPFTNHVYLSSDAQISQSDYQIDSQQFAALNSGSQNNSGTVQTTISGVPAGDYYLGIIADGANTISESNEHNNTGYDNASKVNIPETGGESVILDVPMTGIAPVIDGEMDPVWYSVCSVPLEKQNITEATAPDDWLDTFARFRMMWDEDHYYLFIEAHDDTLNTSHTDAWENDSFEVFFDGDNSKNDMVTGYDANDVQLRYMYGQTTDNMGNAPNSVCQFRDTDYGYNCEIQIPVSDMTFDLDADHIFGFEIQFNDDDNGSRNHLLKWWSASDQSWQDPSLFGTAKTTDYIASDPMYILQASGAPTIDGIDNDAVWDNIPWISSNTFVDRENGILSNPGLNLANVDGCNDCRFDYKLMWRGDMLYLYARVFDDIIEASQPEFWNNDCFEIQIDGNNDKTTSTDSNDLMYTFVYSETPDANTAFQTSSQGWTVEAQMDLAGDLGINPSIGHRIGLEAQVDDNDGSGRDLIGRWWSNDNITWINPSMRGTAELTREEVLSDVTGAPAHNTAVSYHLSQNYPNPFNPETMIQYDLPHSTHVTLDIVNLKGEKMMTLIDEEKQAGHHSVYWNGKDQNNQNLPSGLYVYRLQAGNYMDAKKMILVK